jgi:transcriptional regulator with XRE-family HTH domain
LTHHRIDIHVGARVRQRRILLGMTQTTLGKAVGLTFQQVQKYESGGNRISSSRLFEFSKILNVPVSHFFEEVAPEFATGRRKVARLKRNGSDELASTVGEKPLSWCAHITRSQTMASVERFEAWSKHSQATDRGFMRDECPPYRPFNFW